MTLGDMDYGAFDLIQKLATFVGALWIFSFVYKIYRFITFSFLPRASTTLRQYNQPPGSERCYALITGASAGIGLGVGRALLHRTLGGVILLGHDLEELKAAQSMLLKDFPKADVRIIHHNVLISSEDSLRKALEPVIDLRITILLNNVGGAPTPRPRIRPFTKLDYSQIDAYVDLNARFMAQITGLLIPILDRSPSPRSLILNMSSGSTFAMPYIVMYTATKSFSLTFSRALSRELRATHPKIDVLCIQPGDVKSQANSEGQIDSMAFGQVLVDHVGIAVRRGMLQMSPLWHHHLGLAIMTSLPDWVVTQFANDIMRPRMLKDEDIAAAERKNH